MRMALTSLIAALIRSQACALSPTGQRFMIDETVLGIRRYFAASGKKTG